MWKTVMDLLSLVVVGMGGVFCALLFLAGMIKLFQSTDEWLNRRRIRQYAEKVDSHEVDDALNDEIVAVLSAAVAITLKKRIVVRKIHFLDNRASGAWATTGRLNIMGSHLVQNRGHK
jgi:hypothetical protein